MPIEKSLNESDTLVIAITTINYKLTMPVEKFLEAAGLADKSRIVITDRTRRLTLGGVSPECPTFFDLLDYLRQEISRLPADRIIATGLSAGSHTALLLGHLLKADHVVAFAPYPYVSKSMLAAQKDPALYSFRVLADNLDRLPEDVKSFFDLRDVLSNWNGKTRYYVHVSRYHKADRHRAMYLKGLPHLELILDPYSVHSAAPFMARSGRLRECFVFPYRPVHRPLRNTLLRSYNFSMVKCRELLHYMRMR